MEKPLFYFNGINGDRGDYDLTPMSAEMLAGIVQGDQAPGNLYELKERLERRARSSFALSREIDPSRLDQSGWGIIFHATADPSLREALADLVEFRRQQAGDRYREASGADGYRPGETVLNFLARHGSGPGPADPARVPYHLLLVGSPDEIPFQFQQELAVNYSVGRIYFPTLEEYRNYARSVVTAESGRVRLPPQLRLFGTNHDPATQLTAEELIKPLAEVVRSNSTQWDVQMVPPQEATKARLSQLLNGKGSPPPALLFAAAHGMSFAYDSKRQRAHQGALLCQDWPGPQEWRKGIPQDFYFSAEDLESDSNLLGSIAIFFASYGAGTSQFDSFSQQAFRSRSGIAPGSFLAQLPARMLSLPHGGALAVIGQVERAWSYAYADRGKDMMQQTEAYQSVLYSLMRGRPIGSAIESFSDRYAELASQLDSMLEDADFGAQLDPLKLVETWTARNDARTLTVLGDPAIRLPVSDSPDSALERPSLAFEVRTPAVQTGSGPTQSAVASPYGQATTEFEPTTGAEPPSWGEPTSGAEPEEQQPVVVAVPGEPATAQEPTIGPTPGGVFGLFKSQDNFGSFISDVSGSMRQFVERLVSTLNATLEAGRVISIRTYLAEDMNQVTLSPSGPGGAKLIAATQVRIEGDIDLILSKEAGEIDKDLLTIHSDMVQKAQAGRAEMLKAMAAAASGLIAGEVSSPPSQK